jgi:probable phosphoglycerate mutase
MTTLLLIRHGMTDAVGRRLTGRLPGVHLNELGQRQARALAARLASQPISAIYASPLERTLETAREIAATRGLEVVVRPALVESDFGEWSGRSLAELAGDPVYQLFNRVRSITEPPGGEHFSAVQARMASELLRIRDAHRDQTVAVVSHADPLRAALCVFLGIGIDLMQELELAPASVSTLRLTEDSVLLLSMNETAGLP